jgi:hypothetical protein
MSVSYIAQRIFLKYIGFVSPDVRLTANDELESMWKEMIVAYPSDR